MGRLLLSIIHQVDDLLRKVIDLWCLLQVLQLVKIGFVCDLVDVLLPLLLVPRHVLKELVLCASRLPATGQLRHLNGLACSARLLQS